MPGTGRVNGFIYAENADYSGALSPSASNGLISNGQLWIGSTIANANGTFINVGNITSPLGTLSINYASPNITMDVIADPTDLHVAKLIVNKAANSGGNYTSITSALAAANSGDTIFIMPSVTPYIEDLNLKANVNICAFECDAQTPNVTIVGKLTATFAGTCTLSGICLQTNSDFCLSISGANTPTVNLIDCFINGSNNTAISMSSTGARIFCTRCKGTLGAAGATYFAITAGIIIFDYCNLPGGVSTTASTANTGTTALFFNYTIFSVSITTANSNTFQGIQSQFTGNSAIALTLNGSGVTSLDLCYVNASSFSAISIGAACGLTIASSEINSTNANAITGAGSVTHGGLTFIANSANINTTTQSVLPSFTTIPRTATAAATYVVLSTDYYISVDCSGGAKQVNLPNAPSLNKVFIVKDKTGNSAANNITVTTVGGAINIDAAATYLIKINYGSAQFVWNGTTYEVF